MGRRQQQRRDREAVAQRLGGGDHVRHDAVIVSRERLARAADAALHFVEDQQRAGFVAALAQRREEFLAHVECAAHALHGLDDDRRRVLGDVFGNVFDVAALDPADVERRTRQEEPFLRRLPGGRGASGGTAVKALFHGRDVRAAGTHFERHLESVLVGLGAGVDPEHAVERQLRKLQQLLCGARADFHRHGIGLEVHLRGLIAQRFRPAFVAVAERSHRVTAIEVQHLAAIARMQPDALGAHHFDGILRVDRRKAVGRRGVSA